MLRFVIVRIAAVVGLAVLIVLLRAKRVGEAPPRVARLGAR